MQHQLSVQDYIRLLDLQPHPEGGYFRETYRSSGTLTHGLPHNISGQRNYATAIYFLIERGNFSALHKIKCDEVWHFYAGDALEVIEINDGGNLKSTLVGNNLEQGERPQHVVLANTWFGSRVAGNGNFTLVGCTVAPGFDFADFEMGTQKALVEKFPQHKEIIAQLTRI